MTTSTVDRLAKRRRVDRERLVQSMPGFSPDYVTGLESWDVELGDLKASVIVARERIESHDWRWHVSVAGLDRVPDWSEFAAIVHDFRPGVVFCMALPPRSWWINIAENCLHAWQLQDDSLEEQWRRERRGDEPS